MVADRGYVSWLTCSKMWWSNSCSPPQRNRVKGLTSTYIIQPWQSWLPLLGLLIHSCLQEFICSCPKWRTVKIDVELWHIMYYLKRAESQNYLYQNGSRVQSRSKMANSQNRFIINNLVNNLSLTCSNNVIGLMFWRVVRSSSVLGRVYIFPSLHPFGTSPSLQNFQSIQGHYCRQMCWIL